jgi:hypothetical protein
MIRVPQEIQVRIISPKPEGSVSHLIVEEAVVEAEMNGVNTLASKIFSGGGVGILLGMGLFIALHLSGANIGNLETSIILGIPCFLGIMASYVIF